MGFRHWLRDSRGATVIEYALILVGIALALAVYFFSTGDSLVSFFQKTEHIVGAAATG